MPSPVEQEQEALAPLATWMQASTSIPVLPELAIRVIALAADPNATVSQLTAVISKDQVLATRLLSLANSAYSASIAEVTTITEAVMRVGANGVRNLAVTVCFASRMQDRAVYGRHGQALVDHGIGTAYMAHLVAESVDIDTDEAFLCGLLHDIGKLVILKWYHEQARRTGQPVQFADVEALLGRWHPIVAGMAFRRWGLPEALDEPVTCHHDWQSATRVPKMAAVVYLANRLSHRYGFGCEPDGYDPLQDPVMQMLGLDADWLADVDARAPGLFAVARQALA